MPVADMTVSSDAYSKPLSVAFAQGDTALLGSDYFAGRVFTIDTVNERIYLYRSPSVVVLIE